MAQLYRYGLTKEQYDKYAKEYTDSWVKSGKAMPTTPAALTQFEVSRDAYVRQKGLGNIQSGKNTQKNISDVFKTVTYPGKATLDIGADALRNLGFLVTGNTAPEPFKHTAETWKDVKPTFEQLADNITKPYTWLHNLGKEAGGTPLSFGATPVDAMTGSAPTPIAAPGVAPKVAPPQTPIPPQTSGSASVGAGISAPVGVGMPNVGWPDLQAREKQILDVLMKGGNMSQEAADMAAKSIEAATTAHDAATGKPPNLLEAYRQALAATPRPERDNAKLTTDDKYDTLARFGFGMLSRNTETFGEALGKAGTEAMNFADKTLEQRYNDALAKYQERLGQIATETNLSQKDYDNQVTAANNKLDKDVRVITAKQGAAVAKAPWMQKQAETMTDVLKQQVEMAKAKGALAAENARTNAILRSGGGKGSSQDLAIAKAHLAMKLKAYQDLQKVYGVDAITASQQLQTGKVPANMKPQYDALVRAYAEYTAAMRAAQDVMIGE